MPKKGKTMEGSIMLAAATIHLVAAIVEAWARMR
jgi:hypothetical protein